MAWIYLGLAAFFEVIFAMGMKMSDGFTRPLATVVTLVAIVGGLWFLTLSLRGLPVSIAYPIWTGVGTLGTVLLGTLMLGESMSLLKLASAGLIVAGVAGLKIAAG